MGKEKEKKRRHSSSSESGSDSEKKKLKKLKKKLKKERRKAEKIMKKKMKEEKKKLKKKRSKSSSSNDEATEKVESAAADIPIELMERSKAMAPMTKEEWDKRQSIIRKVLDEESGRYRLIKGDGEVLEEIVSKDRHKDINRSATRADGSYFQAQTVQKKQFEDYY